MSLRVPSCVALLNPRAGNGLAKRLFQSILQDRFRTGRVPFVVVEMQSSEEVVEHATAPEPAPSTSWTRESGSSVCRQRSSWPLLASFRWWRCDKTTTTEARSGTRKRQGLDAEQSQVQESSETIHEAGKEGGGREAELPRTSAGRAQWLQWKLNMGATVSVPWEWILSQKEVECLVVVGGDGTLNRVVNTLHRAWLAVPKQEARTAIIPRQQGDVRETSPEDIAGLEREEDSSPDPIHEAGALAPTRVSQSHSDDRQTRSDFHHEKSCESGAPELWMHKSVVLLPAGSDNSVAFNLGVCDVERTVSTYVAGRREPVRVWELWRHRPVVLPTEEGRPQPPESGQIRGCAFVSSVRMGVLTREHSYWKRWREEWNQFVALPQLSANADGPTANRAIAAVKASAAVEGSRSLFTSPMSMNYLMGRSSFSTACSRWFRFWTMALAIYSLPPSASDRRLHGWWSRWIGRRGRTQMVYGDVELILEPPATPHREVRRLKGPFPLLVVSAFPAQSASCWLTPCAQPRGEGLLSVTLATEEATRTRLWHLLRREARQGALYEEDGVQCFDHVRSIRLHLWPSSSVSSFTAEAAGDARVASKEEKAQDAAKPHADAAAGGCDALIDGEAVTFLSGETVEWVRTENHIYVLTC